MALLNCAWPPGPTQPTLGDAEVHVWCADLDQAPEPYTALLSADEISRAQRFHFESDRHRFMVGRGVLRILLGKYLKLAPAQIEFDYGSHGKPVLAARLASPVCFNLAHSHTLALYAVTRQRALGVDVEALRPLLEAQTLVHQFFSPEEKAELEALPPDQRLEVFFNGWTRKEAYLKARGEGMTYSLDQFSVTMSPTQPAKLLKVKEGADELARWALQRLAPAPDYVGAIAVEGHSWDLTQWQFGLGLS